MSYRIGMLSTKEIRNIRNIDIHLHVRHSTVTQSQDRVHHDIIVINHIVDRDVHDTVYRVHYACTEYNIRVPSTVYVYRVQYKCTEYRVQYTCT